MLSISGHPVLDAPSWSDPRLRRGTVPYTTVQLLCHRDALPLLLHAAATLHKHVLPLSTRDTWSYAARPGRMAGATPSDHWAGMAVDLWAARIGAHTWPPRMSATQARRMLAIITNYRTASGARIFGWGAHISLGGDYRQHASSDPMHVYVRRGVTAAQLRETARRMRIGADGKQVPARRAA